MTKGPEPAKQEDEKIQNFEQLTKKLDTLSIENRVKYISDANLNLNSLIRTPYSWMLLLEKLPEEKRSSFARDQKLNFEELIFNANTLRGFLSTLPANERIAFIQEHKIDLSKVIKNINDLEMVLREIPENNQSEFIRANLITFLKVFPKEEHQHPTFLNSVKNFDDVKSVLKTGKDEDEKILFLKSFAIKIKEFIDIEQLAKIIIKFSEENRMAATSGFFPYIKELIKEFVDVGKMIRVIPLKDWSIFVEKTDLKNAIKDTDELLFILKSLQEANRTPFLKALNIDIKKLDLSKEQSRTFDQLLPSLAKSFMALFTRNAEPKPFDARENPANAPRENQQKRPEG